MDYREKVFMTVAEQLNFTKASEILYISQPAVTNHIHELERQKGLALFTRKGNKNYLTNAGEMLFTRLKSIEKLYNELDFELGGLKGESEGALRLGASSTIAQYVIPDVLASFHRRYPKVALTMESGNSKQIEDLLTDNQIDVALVENSSGLKELRYTPFAKDTILVVTGAQSIYAKKGSLSLGELVSTPIILREQGSGTLETVLHALTECEIDASLLNVCAHLGATEAIKHFLYGYDSIAFISETAVKKEIDKQLLKILSVPGLSVFRHFRIAERQGPQLTLQSLFINLLLSYNFPL
jgi:LysR family transcriptional regulator, transcriptional activator of the cysJI operon